MGTVRERRAKTENINKLKTSTILASVRPSVTILKWRIQIHCQDFLLEDRRKRREITNNQFVQPHQTGTSFHTTWSVDGKGDRLWLTFDPSRPCSMFCTTETRFLKPKLHTVLPDPYERRP